MEGDPSIKLERIVDLGFSRPTEKEKPDQFSGTN
jgi:hypothetical protein